MMIKFLFCTYGLRSEPSTSGINQETLPAVCNWVMPYKVFIYIYIKKLNVFFNGLYSKTDEAHFLEGSCI